VHNSIVIDDNQPQNSVAQLPMYPFQPFVYPKPLIFYQFFPYPVLPAGFGNCSNSLDAVLKNEQMAIS
jgi:hypothetical protein